MTLYLTTRKLLTKSKIPFQVTGETTLNGRAAKKAGNHSEGYFSSDPDDDSKPKLFEVKLKNSDLKGKIYM